MKNNFYFFENISFKIFFIFSIIIFTVYFPSLFNEFVYDDFETITENHYITSLKNIIKCFTDKETTSPTTHLKYEIYRPIKTLSVMFDYFLYKKNPLGFHITNLLLHLIVVLLIFYLLKLLKFSFISSFIGAIFFAIHPALSHNVAYISARADIISAIFIILSLIFLQNTKRMHFITSLLFFFIACLGKETAIMFPLILICTSFIKEKNINKVMPFFIIAALYFIIRQSVVGHLSQTDYHMKSFLITQATMIKVWAYYFSGFFLPLKTDIIPIIITENTLFNIRTFIALISLFFIAFLLLKLNIKNKMFYAGIIWFIIFLIPVSNIIPIKAFMSLRFLYIPWIGFSISLASLINEKIYSKKIKYIFTIWLIILSFQTFFITKSFKNDFTLWYPLTEKYPNLIKPYRVVGYYYLKQNNFDMANYYFSKGLKYYPNDDYLNLDMTKCKIANNEFDSALNYLKKVKNIIENETNYSYLYYELLCLYNLEKHEEIIKRFNSDEIKLLPENILFIYGHSFTLLKQTNIAKKIYLELLNRNININEREDCINILKLIDLK